MRPAVGGPDRDVRPALAGVGLVALVLLALAAAWARLMPVGSWELAILVALEPSTALHGDAARALSTWGNLDVWAIFVISLAVIALAFRQPMAAAVIAMTLLSDVAGYLVKLAVERDRPANALLEGLVGGDSFAFPSGHVVRAAALAALLAWLLVPARGRLPAALAGGIGAGLVMGYSRLALGVHWPSDVAGGILLGIAWFCGSAIVLISAERPAPRAA